MLMSWGLSCNVGFCVCSGLFFCCLSLLFPSFGFGALGVAWLLPVFGVFWRFSGVSWCVAGFVKFLGSVCFRFPGLFPLFSFPVGLVLGLPLSTVAFFGVRCFFLSSFISFASFVVFLSVAFFLLFVWLCVAFWVFLLVYFSLFGLGFFPCLPWVCSFGPCLLFCHFVLPCSVLSGFSSFVGPLISSGCLVFLFPSCWGCGLCFFFCRFCLFGFRVSFLFLCSFSFFLCFWYAF